MSLATALANLETARDNVTALLADLSAHPKPTYSLDGESYSWESYFSMLCGQLETLNKQIQVLGGPFEIKSSGLT